MLNQIVRPHLHFSFLVDAHFRLALLAAPLFLILLSWLYPNWSHGIQVNVSAFFVIAMWQPFIEEVLFRGIIQGQLKLKPAFQASVGAISVANLVTSVLFGLAHLVNHAPGWAAAVVIPSLIFGYFRDRHHTLLSCILLHAAYNIFYLAIGAIHYSSN